jgi:hypothetical protein
MMQRELQSYGVVRLGPLEQARLAFTHEPERWAGIVAFEGAHDGAELLALRTAFARVPLLSLALAPRCAPSRRPGDAERFPSSEQRAQIVAFARNALARAFVPDEHVAAIVERLARESELTAREVQLLCFSLGDEPRALVRKRLGISDNTLKTQVRGLLRKAGQPNVDTLALNVLREAMLLKRRLRTPRELCTLAS